MKYKNYISEEIIAGQPFFIIEDMQKELVRQFNKDKMSGYKDYENMCNNMRLIADIIEICGNYINDDFIVLKYNPMGSWYKENNKDIEYYKKECL